MTKLKLKIVVLLFTFFSLSFMTRCEAQTKIDINKEEGYAQIGNVSMFYDDFVLLTKTVSAEAGNQDIETQQVIAEIILNRVDSDLFPNTLLKVVYQETNGFYQFSCVPKLEKEQPSEKTIDACINAIIERNTDKDVLFFNSLGCYFSWAEDYDTIGDFHLSKPKAHLLKKERN